jgi:hypothetical protein
MSDERVVSAGNSVGTAREQISVQQQARHLGIVHTDTHGSCAQVATLEASIHGANHLTNDATYIDGAGIDEERVPVTASELSFTGTSRLS